MEHRSDLIRVWADLDDEDDPGPDTPYLEFGRAALPEMVLAAQRDLLDFLNLLRPWALKVAPERADELLAAFDSGLGISAPLDLGRT